MPSRPSTQGHVLRLSEARRQQRGEGREDLEDAGAVGPLRLVQDNGLEEPDEVLGAGTPQGPALANGSEVELGLEVEVDLEEDNCVITITAVTMLESHLTSSSLCPHSSAQRRGI